jgi:hypothetical protein
MTVLILLTGSDETGSSSGYVDTTQRNKANRRRRSMFPLDDEQAVANLEAMRVCVRVDRPDDAKSIYFRRKSRDLMRGGPCAELCRSSVFLRVFERRTRRNSSGKANKALR